MKRYYRVYLWFGREMRGGYDTPLSRGLDYAVSMAKAYAKKEGADGFCVDDQAGRTRAQQYVPFVQ